MTFSSRRDARERPRHDSNVFFDRDNLIGPEICQLRDCSAGPYDFERIYLGTLPQSKMKPRVLRGLVTHASFFLITKNKLASRYLHPRTHAVSIRFRAD